MKQSIDFFLYLIYAILLGIAFALLFATEDNKSMKIGFGIGMVAVALAIGSHVISHVL